MKNLVYGKTALCFSQHVNTGSAVYIMSFPWKPNAKLISFAIASGDDSKKHECFSRNYVNDLYRKGTSRSVFTKGCLAEPQVPRRGSKGSAIKFHYNIKITNCIYVAY
jgi:hypothetical protein